MSKLPVLCVIGPRPEAIKMLPVIVALRASQHLQPVVVVTGQHQHMVGRWLVASPATADVE